MAFKAVLKIGSKEYDVMSCSYSFSRDVDGKGKPSSKVYGGTISLTIESTEETAILEAMVNNKHKPFDGTVTYFKTDEDAKMKEMSFTKGYVTSFSEGFNSYGGESTTTNFVISAEKIKIGSGEHDNEWPTS